MTARAWLLCGLVGAVWLSGATVAWGHDMRPSLLDLREWPGGMVEVEWRVAFARGAAMPLTVSLEPECAQVAPPRVTTGATVRVESWTWQCGEQGLKERRLTVHGLDQTGTDALLRLHRGEDTSTLVLTPSEPSSRVSADARFAPPVTAYLGLGVEHILLGPDHLLFVLGLFLLVAGRLPMLWLTLTAFTLGHSVTLIIAAMGWVTFPTRAVEAIIALSILLLAWELAQRPEAPRGAPQEAREGSSLAHRNPWVFAVVCGLIHGLGFAGALSDVGLPKEEVGAALLLFNVGVELGQILFVLALMILVILARHTNEHARLRRLAYPITVYALGGLAAFWLLDRAAPIVQAAFTS